MAELVGAIGTSHIPAVGVAIDKGRTEEPYWAPYFDKLPPAREWMADGQARRVHRRLQRPRQRVLARADPDVRARRGRRTTASPTRGSAGDRCPTSMGHPELAWHLAESLILDEFDMTLVNEMEVDHGLTVPLSVAYGQPDAWPCKVIPLAVNVVQYPPPTGNRCYRLGQAIRRAIDSYPGDERIVIFGTGGMSHQLQAQRAGLINAEWDAHFLDLLVNDPETAAKIPHVEYLREAGSRGHRAGDVADHARGDEPHRATRSTAPPTSPPTPTTACWCSRTRDRRTTQAYRASLACEGARRAGDRRRGDVASADGPLPRRHDRPDQGTTDH